MKNLLTLFVLFFSSLVFANDISDFQIEGISVGDSLLDHFSEEEINNFYKRNAYPSTNNFLQVNIDNQILKNYNIISVAIKKNDPNYLIYEIKGFKRQENLRSCLNQKKIVSSEIKDLLKDVKAKEYETIFAGDKSGKTKFYSSDFNLKTGSIRIYCFDWSNEMKKKGGYYDESLTVVIYNNEFKNFLNNLAYN